MSMRTTFDDLATMFEGSSASGAERAYRRAVEKLTKNLVEAGALHVVELKRKSQRKKKQKIAAAVYEYRVDYDGEWGEISFDFVQGTAEIVKLAESDADKSIFYANATIYEMISVPEDDLKKHFIIPVYL